MKKLLVIILILSLITTTFMVHANENINEQVFKDIKGHWAEKTINSHHNMGMLKGYPDGTFRPDQGMKRSELITVINRYFGLKETGKENYEDVQSDKWYSNETAKARYYGYIKELRANPEKEASREDVVDMISLILDVEEQKIKSSQKDFEDIEGLTEEEQENILRFSEMGYIQGYEDGTFKPNKTINRAEIMTIAENTLGYIVRTQEDIENLPENVNKVTIINPGIILDNKEINGDVYISPGVNGQVRIKNTKIKGQIEISGGTEDKPIKLEDVEANKVVITKAKGQPSIQITGQSKIDNLKTKSKVNMQLMDKSTVENLVVQQETIIETEKDTVIETVEIEEKTVIKGKGKIKNFPRNKTEIEISKEIKVGKSTRNHSKGGSSNYNPNTDPEATEDTVNVDENDTILIDVLSNDIDSDGDTLTIKSFTQGSNGEVTQEGSKLRYIPSEDFNGEDSFTYTISDARQGKDIASVNIIVNDKSSPKWKIGYPYAEMKTSESKIKIVTKLNEKSTVYYTVYEILGGGTSPDFTVNDLIASGNKYDIEANTVTEEVYGGIDLQKNHNVYLTAVDSNGNKQSSIKEIQVSKIDTTPPIFTSKTVTPGDNLGDIKLTALTNETATIYYVVANAGSTTPTVEQVKVGNDYADVNVLAKGYKASLTEEVISGFEENTNYDIYLIAEDAKGNVTEEVSKISIKTKRDFGTGIELNPYKIYKIEDLVSIGRIHSETNDKWELNKYYTLMNNLDFQSNSSYRNPSTTYFGDINGNGILEGLKDELTTEKGWNPIRLHLDYSEKLNVIKTSLVEFGGVKEDATDEEVIAFCKIGIEGEMGQDTTGWTDQEIIDTVYTMLQANTTGNGFDGSFNGNHFSISNLYIDRNSTTQGLFEILDSGSAITNLNITDSSIKASSTSGVLAGKMQGSQISNVLIKNTTFELYTHEDIEGALVVEFVGGLVGKATNGTIESSRVEDLTILNDKGKRIGGLVGTAEDTFINNSTVNTVTLTGSSFIGGMIGNVVDGTLKYSNAENVNISGRASHSGGMIGNNKRSTISNCRVNNVNIEASGYGWNGGMVGWNTGNIDNSSVKDVLIHGAGYDIGGLVGKSINNDITTSSAEGVIIDSSSEIIEVGGFAGAIDNVTISNSYAVGTVTGAERVGGLIGIAEGDVTIEKTYTAVTVTGERSVGGIIGNTRTPFEPFNHKINITDSVAFNEGGISGTENNVNRIVGLEGNITSKEYTNNYAYKDMVVKENNISKTGTSDSSSVWGADITALTNKDSQPLASWDFDTIWEMNPDEGRPVLK